MAAYPQWFDPDVTDSPRTENFIIRAITHLLAGAASERKFRGCIDDDEWESDREKALGLALRITGSGEEAEALLNWLYLRAEGIVSHPLYWPGIAVVAAALMKHREIDGRKFRKVVQMAVKGALPPEVKVSENS